MFKWNLIYYQKQAKNSSFYAKKKSDFFLWNCKKLWFMIDNNYETRKSVKTKNHLAIFQIAPCTWHTWAGNCDQDFDDGKNYQWNCQNVVDFWEKIGQKIRVSSKWNSKNSFWPFSKIPIVGTYIFLTATFMKSQYVTRICTFIMKLP